MTCLKEIERTAKRGILVRRLAHDHDARLFHGLNCFTVGHGIGAVHKRTITGGGKASVKLPQFQAVNIVLGNLKTALCGTYHAFDFAKYAHRYHAEAQYRFNRRFDPALHPAAPGAGSRRHIASTCRSHLCGLEMSIISWLQKGLTPGASVIVCPPSAVKDGARVKFRKV